jgi:hypothetical protein
MTGTTAPTDAAAPAPTGLRAKAGEVGLKAYLKAPPPAQNAMLQGYLKAQPVIARVSPHARKLVGAGLGVLALRTVRRRSR